MRDLERSMIEKSSVLESCVLLIPESSRADVDAYAPHPAPPCANFSTQSHVQQIPKE
jgi:hypothetical protein